MPGQEKMVMDYYQKNPSAVASLKGALYEEKVIDLIKSKIKLTKKSVTLKEAEEIIKKFTRISEESKKNDLKKNHKKSKNKTKKQKELAKSLLKLYKRYCYDSQNRRTFK